MEEKKQSNVFKTVLLVFGIIFSIILVPVLIVGIPVEGAAVALSQTVSREGIEKIVDETNLSEKAYQLVMDEITNEVRENDTLNPDFLSGIIKDCFSVEIIDGVITEVIGCVYSGTEPNIDLNSVADSVKKSMEDLATNGFSDFYEACFDGAESRFFTSEFIRSNKSSIEEELLGKYPEFKVGSLEELEREYDAQFGAGEYKKLFDEEIAAFEAEWETDILDGFDEEIGAVVDEAEQEVNRALYDMVQEPDLRTAFDVLNEVSVKKDTIKLLAYVIVLVAVLLLLVCYWFRTAGFVVPAVALILGGLLCKLVTLLENKVLSLIRKEIAAIPEAAEVSEVAMNICKGIIAPFFDEMSKFGITMIGIGVVLVLCAILRNVLKKNATAAEETM